MRRRHVIPVAAMLVVLVALGACSAEDPTANSGLTLPQPDPPDTLLPILDDTEPPEVTDTLPSTTLFHGDVCTALTQADFAHVFGSAVRLTDSGLLAVDTCLYLLREGSKRFDVRVELSSLQEFTAPTERNLPDAVPVLPTTVDTTPFDTGVGTAPTIPVDTGLGTTPTSVAASSSTVAPSIDELDGIGLGSRGLVQGVRYEVYAKVDRGFFSVLAPTKGDAIALAKLVVPHA